MQFQGRFVNFVIFFMEICSLGCDWCDAIICLDNGLVVNRRQLFAKPMMTQFSGAYMQPWDKLACLLCALEMINIYHILQGYNSSKWLKIDVNFPQ